MDKPEVVEETAVIEANLSFEAIATGRTTKYTREHAKALYQHYLIEFTEKKTIMTKFAHKAGAMTVEAPNRLPTVSSFCRKMGICRKTFYNWCRDNDEFLHIYEWGKTVLEDMITQLTLNGTYTATNAMLAARITKKYDTDIIRDEDMGDGTANADAVILPYYINQQPTMDDFRKINGETEAIQDVQAAKDIQQD